MVGGSLKGGQKWLLWLTKTAFSAKFLYTHTREKFVEKREMVNQSNQRPTLKGMKTAASEGAAGKVWVLTRDNLAGPSYE
jgi:hypothetical protein